MDEVSILKILIGHTVLAITSAEDDDDELFIAIVSSIQMFQAIHAMNNTRIFPLNGVQEAFGTKIHLASVSGQG